MQQIGGGPRPRVLGHATFSVVMVMAAAMGALVASAGSASAVPACPSGSDGSRVYAVGGVDLGKSCFRWDDRKAMVQDTNSDSISAYVAFVYYNAGWKGGQWWDSDGANNGWEYTSTLAASTTHTVGIQTCAYDKDGSSGRYDYGCSSQTVIQPQHSV
ncbi:MAG TPA: hypothetical protein VGM94_03755 [Galbitalea sp.]|jgi:hypothetical protein